MKRQYPSIDILKLFAGNEAAFFDGAERNDPDGVKFMAGSTKETSSHEKWNAWLTRCLKTNDLESLIKVRYGLMVGMDDLTKKGLTTQKIAELWCRWIGSIEKTARKVIKKKNPLPKIDKATDLDTFNRVHEAKKRRDNEFEAFLRRSSF